MLTRFTKLLIASTLFASALAGCTDFATTEDPCASSNRPITYENLFEHSVIESYEQCLNQLRSDAAAALE